jgi:hypothetical protein
MPFAPSSTLSLTSDELILKAELHAIIDAELLLSFEPEKSADIRHALIFEVYEQNPRLLTELISTYEQLGWVVVKYESKDQGMWLSFSA